MMIEHNKGATKRCPPPILRARARVMGLALGACFCAPPFWVSSAWSANFTDATVANGVASASQNGNILTITNSNGAILDWAKFGIGVGETVKFDQTSAASSVLNRVLAGGGLSAIYGTLSSNGRVFLINPAGIMIGAGGVVDTAGFVASTLSMRNSDFLAGKLTFGTPGEIGGDVVNKGSITSPTGGAVYLIGSNVTNEGIINTPKGEVILAAGETVSLIDTSTPGIRVDITGAAGNTTNLGDIAAEAGRIGMAGVIVKNSGILNASSAVADGGRIFLKASGDTYVDKQAKITATGTRGGSVEVLGNRVAVMDQAQIDVSGVGAGGTALIGGDYQGKNPDTQNSQITYFGQDASIKADAIDTGNGGKVIVWADDTTRAYGTISARGGANGGDGGFVETSGHSYLDFNAQVDTRAAFGKTGTLLLDPADVTISASANSGVGSFSVNIFGGGSGTSNINWGTIDGLLSSSDVVITTLGGSGSGNITLGSAFTLTGANTLRLLAQNDINTAGYTVSNSTAGAGLMYVAGWDTVSTGSSAAAFSGTGNILGGGNVTLNAGAFTARAGSSISLGTISTVATGAAGSGTVELKALAGSVNVSGAINTYGNASGGTGYNGGNITINAGTTVNTSDINTYGGASTLGGIDGANAGSLSINSVTGISTGSIYTNGGAGGGGGASAGGNGGNGGDITFMVSGTGAIAVVGYIATYGGAGGSAGSAGNGGSGGSGGLIDLRANNGNVSLSGYISTIGGNAGNGSTTGSGGSGGSGGGVVIHANGSGSATFSSYLDTYGGVGGTGGGTGGTGGAGGAGGDIEIIADTGVSLTSAIDATGGTGGTGGAGSPGGAGGYGGHGGKLKIDSNSGNVSLISHDGSGGTGGSGGAGTTPGQYGDGGNAGEIRIHSGGTTGITVSSTVFAQGGFAGTSGSGAGYGGYGGVIHLHAYGSGNVSVSGQASSAGGTGKGFGDGGSGGAIEFWADGGTVTLGATASSFGGNAAAGGDAGSAGAIDIRASGDITINTLNAYGGNSASGSYGGDGGSIKTRSETGNIVTNAQDVSGGSAASGYGGDAGSIRFSKGTTAGTITATLMLNAGSGAINGSGGALSYHSDDILTTASLSGIATAVGQTSVSYEAGNSVVVSASNPINTSASVVLQGGSIFVNDTVTSSAGDVFMFTPGALGVTAAVTAYKNALLVGNNVIIGSGGSVTSNYGDVGMLAFDTLTINGSVTASDTYGQVLLAGGNSVNINGAVTATGDIGVIGGLPNFDYNNLPAGAVPQQAALLKGSVNINSGGSLTTTNDDIGILAQDINITGGLVNSGNSAYLGAAQDIRLNNGGKVVAANDIYLGLFGGDSKLYINELATGQLPSYLWAQSPDTIHIAFPLLGSGGIVINGVETTTTSGASGFFAGPAVGGIKSPASQGKGLNIAYGATKLDAALAQLFNDTGDDAFDKNTNTGDGLPGSGSGTTLASGGDTVGGGQGEFGSKDGEDDDKDKKGDDANKGKKIGDKDGRKQAAQCRG